MAGGTLIAADGGIAIRPDGGRAREDCCGCGGSCGAGCSHEVGEIHVYGGTGSLWCDAGLIDEPLPGCVPWVDVAVDCCCGELAQRSLEGTVTWRETGWVHQYCSAFPSKRNYSIDGTGVLKLNASLDLWYWECTIKRVWAADCFGETVNTTEQVNVPASVGYRNCVPGSDGPYSAGPAGCERCFHTGNQEGWTNVITVDETRGCAVYEREYTRVFDWPRSASNSFGRHSEFAGTVKVGLVDGSGCGETGNKGGKGPEGQGKDGQMADGQRARFGSALIWPSGHLPSGDLTTRWMGMEWMGRAAPRRVWDWMRGRGWYRDGQCGCWKRGKGWWERVRGQRARWQRARGPD